MDPRYCKNNTEIQTWNKKIRRLLSDSLHATITRRRRFEVRRDDEICNFKIQLPISRVRASRVHV